MVNWKMGSWQHGEYSSLYDGFLPDLTGLNSGVIHNGENFSIKVVTNYGDKIEFNVLVGQTVGKVILHIYRNKAKMMSQGAKVLPGGMKAGEVLARNLLNMLEEVSSRNMERKRGHPKTPEQQDIDKKVSLPTGGVYQNNIIREMHLKNMELTKKLKESDAALVKEKQDKEKKTKKLT